MLRSGDPRWLAWTIEPSAVAGYYLPTASSTHPLESFLVCAGSRRLRRGLGKPGIIGVRRPTSSPCPHPPPGWITPSTPFERGPGKEPPKECSSTLATAFRTTRAPLFATAGPLGHLTGERAPLDWSRSRRRPSEAGDDVQSSIHRRTERDAGGNRSMKVAILAGGLGTRLSEETAIRPKPMVEIGGKPILWHIMNIYAAHGFKEFVVALGYKGEHDQGLLPQLPLPSAQPDGPAWTPARSSTHSGDSRRLGGPSAGHRCGHADRRPGEAPGRVHRRRAVHAHLRRRRRQRRCPQAGRVPPRAGQAGHGHRRAPPVPLRPDGRGRRTGGGVQGEAPDRRRLDQRRLLRARAGHHRLHRRRHHVLGI